MCGIVNAYFSINDFRWDFLKLVNATTNSNPAPHEPVIPIKIHMQEADKYLTLKLCFQARKSLKGSVL